MCRGCGDGKRRWHLHPGMSTSKMWARPRRIPNVISLRPHALLIPPPPSHLSQRSLCTQRLSQSILSPPSFIIIRLPILWFFSSPWDDTLFVHGSPCSTHIQYWHLHTLLFISFLSLGKSFSKFPPTLVFTSVGESEEAA